MSIYTSLKQRMAQTHLRTPPCSTHSCAGVLVALAIGNLGRGLPSQRAQRPRRRGSAARLEGLWSCPQRTCWERSAPPCARREIFVGAGGSLRPCGCPAATRVFFLARPPSCWQGRLARGRNLVGNLVGKLEARPGNAKSTSSKRGAEV